MSGHGFEPLQADKMTHLLLGQYYVSRGKINSLPNCELKSM